MDLRSIGGARVVAAATADVGATRERVRQARMRKLVAVLTPVAVLLVIRAVTHPGQGLSMPHIPSGLMPYLPGFILVALLSVALVLPLLGAGRSPHVLYRPGEIDVSFNEVRGAGIVLDEVVK